MRVHCDQPARDRRHLAKQIGRAFLLLDIDDVADLQHLGRRVRLDALAVDDMAHGEAHVLGRNRTRLALLRQLSGDFALRLQADRQSSVGAFQHDGELPFGHVGQRLDFAQRHAPVGAELDRLHRAAVAAQRVVFQQAVLHRLAGDELHLRVERRAHRQAALVKRVLAVARDDLAADFLGEVFAGEEVGAVAARLDAERLSLRLVGFLARDVAVLDHLVDDPVAALDRSLGVAERMVVRRRLGQRREVCGLSDGQLVDRFVVVGQRRAGDAIGAEAEEDLVEVEFEDAVLADRPARCGRTGSLP